jgi:hypothetical protein
MKTNRSITRRIAALLAVGLSIAVNSQAQTFLTNGLVAYYPFNGNANDASGNGNNGTIHNGVILAPDRFGTPNSAYQFNGIDGYMDIGNPVGNNPINLTETAWVNILSRSTIQQDPPDRDVIITKRQTGGLGYDWTTLCIAASGANTGQGMTIVDDDGYYNLVMGVTKTQTNNWVFICGIRRNSTTYEIYINGALENSITDSHPMSGSLQNMFLMHDGAWGTYCHGMLDDVRIYNRALSATEVAQLYAIESSNSPRIAAGTATVINGFVIGVTITDYGSGYTNTPVVRLIGGGGSGAGAYATISNGRVTSITVTNTGNSYTNAPFVAIDPPYIFNPVLGIAPMSFLTFSNLTVGGAYQLQQSVAWYWTNQSGSFTATNARYTQMVGGVAGSSDYRLALNPVPAQAFATSQVVNGFVVGAAVTTGGSGYVTSPPVSIVGGGGTNATAVSHITGGVVTSLSITSAGIGYTNTPTIQIGQPPAAALSPMVLPVMRVDSANLAPYNNYQIQFKPDLRGTWENWNGGLFTPTAVTNSQYIFITNGAGFFRIQYAP